MHATVSVSVGRLPLRRPLWTFSILHAAWCPAPERPSGTRAVIFPWRPDISVVTRSNR
jgi:hypothetical protein